ncbi:MAG: selenium cofactor biosynthesis protein YqeC [Chloroflexi bacterium]|nr:selenium cofactor biosynthesis protein YqeC [Chloroflexota bacterium]
MITLREGLRFKGPFQAAFLGAGGKSAAIFQLAGQLQGPVFVTTTTHLSTEQAALGDQHLVLEPGKLLPSLEVAKLPDLTVISGPQEGGRVSAIEPEILKELSLFARQNGIPMLVEADGARQLALKAPAEHEPAIPDFVDVVVVVAGLSALHKPLDKNLVHRPERFAEIADMAVGELVEAEHIGRVLAHERGGLKRIPEGARRVVLLNQAEGDMRLSAAKRLAKELTRDFDAVLSASLSPPDGSKPGVVATYEPVAGILLAAGGSERAGSPKQLLDWNKKPFVRQVAETALAAGLSSLVVVTGAFRADVEMALVGLPITAVNNPDWLSGQASSVKAGLAALPPRTGAAIFMVVDQPQLPVALLESLRAEHARSLAPIIATQVDGKRSNPVLFDRSTFSDFDAIEGDVGGRAIFAHHRVVWLPWLDASLAIDVDTLEDYQRLLNSST